MSVARSRSIGMRVVKFLLGTDQPAFVITAAGLVFALGILIVFTIIYSSPPTNSPVWQTIGAGIGAGLALGLFLMPFLFMGISRMSSFMSPWEALATHTAAWLCPLIMWRLGASGVNGFVLLAGCIAFVVAAFLTARFIVKRSARP
jgi:hypothetical protein